MHYEYLLNKLQYNLFLKYNIDLNISAVSIAIFFKLMLKKERKRA